MAIERWTETFQMGMLPEPEGEFYKVADVEAQLAPITDEEWAQHIDSGLTCIGHANAILEKRRKQL